MVQTNCLKSYQREYLNYLLSGNHRECSKLVSKFTATEKDFKILYEEVIKSSLYEVGKLWEMNKISVATEHMASSIVEANLNELYPSIISSEKLEKTAIVTCIESEMHQIGGKMVADVLEKQGWNVHFLGANTPTNELFSFVSDIEPQILGISLSIYFHLPALKSLLKRTSSQFPDLQIIVGGQAFQHGGHEELKQYPNVAFISNLDEVEKYIKEI
ncbi:MAG: B12-binding domain-containing protein [Bacteroidales bacterium]